MRGNWDETETLGFAPEQLHLHQLQHQQQSPPPASSPDRPPQSTNMLLSEHKSQILKQELQGTTAQQQQQQEQATTPAWSNLLVKEEPEDEKNNDSGISPGHYTSDSASPHSDRSVVRNMHPVGQLSPTDSTTNSIDRQSGSPDNFSTTSNGNAHHQMYSELNGNNNTSHSPLDYGQMQQDEISCASPSSSNQNYDDEHDMGDQTENLSTPVVNAQGRVKTFRCKQCSFVAVTKISYWEHTKTHIKPEKMLTCPKCPFVTEYKHHLEYHIRNHFGSKPYKCDKCAYSCVNKSMLNSHLKSHSNVYQFRCADCSYATKYCHSLKLHLRKYEHKPAMVLNADGSPNPLPIIDIYGTRRGPKTKPKQAKQQTEEQIEKQKQQQQSNNLLNPMIPAVVAQQQQQQHPMPLTPQFQFTAMNGFNGFNGVNAQNPGMMPTPFLGFPYNQLFGGFPLANAFAVAANNNNNSKAGNHNNNNNNLEANEQQIEQLKANILEFTKNMANQQKAAEEFPIAGFNQTNGGSMVVKNEEHMPFNNYIPMESKSPSPAKQLADLEQKSAPLDLSKPETSSSSSVSSPKASGGGNRRRKGQPPVRLDRRMTSRDSDEEMPDEEESHHQQVLPPASSPPNSEDSSGASSASYTEAPHSPINPVQFCEVNSDVYVCNYCEISFRNKVMHSVHMGYHGYKNPYACNMCGDEFSDKVDFFEHIGHPKH